MKALTYEEWQRIAATVTNSNRSRRQQWFDIFAQGIPGGPSPLEDTNLLAEQIVRGNPELLLKLAMDGPGFDDPLTRKMLELNYARELDGDRFTTARQGRVMSSDMSWYYDFTLDVEEFDGKFRFRYPGVVCSLWDTMREDAVAEEIGRKFDKMRFDMDVIYLAKAKHRHGGWSCAGIKAPATNKLDWVLIIPVPVLLEYFGSGVGKDVKSQTYYELLGLKDSNVSRGAIKKAYYRYAKQWHPDVSSEPGTQERFQRLVQAYECLSNPERKQKYDAVREWKEKLGPVENSGSLFGYGNAPRRRSQVPVSKFTVEEQADYQPPLRCGKLSMEGHKSGRWFIADEILNWEDITNSYGQTLVTSWGRDGLRQEWT